RRLHGTRLSPWASLERRVHAPVARVPCRRGRRCGPQRARRVVRAGRRAHSLLRKGFMFEPASFSRLAVAAVLFAGAAPPAAAELFFDLGAHVTRLDTDIPEGPKLSTTG